MLNNDESNDNRKPLIYYTGVVILIILVFNLLFLPWLVHRQIQDVDYNTFVQKTKERDLDQVELQHQTNQIIFTDNETIYQTAMVDDPALTERLLEADSNFNGQIIEQTSPIISFLLYWIVPILIFTALGRYMNKKLMSNRARDNKMSFGLGKSNAKVYVESTEGINFLDVAGQGEAKDSLSEVIDYLHNPDNLKMLAQKCLRVFYLSDLLVPVKPCLPVQWQMKRMSLSFLSQVQNLWKCSPEPVQPA